MRHFFFSRNLQKNGLYRAESVAISKHTTFEDRYLRATELHYVSSVVDTGEGPLSTTRGRAVQLRGLIDGNHNQY